MLSRFASVVSAPLIGLGLLATVLTSSLQAKDLSASDRSDRARRITAARMAHASSADYSPYDPQTSEIAKAAYARLEKGEFTTAIAELTEALAKAPYDVDLLPALDSAYRKSGETAKADETRDRWVGVIDSILESGDGRSFETAFKVISVREEYIVIRALRLEPQGQTLKSNGKGMFDVMKVKSPKSEETFDLYFNIDLPHRWLRQQLGGGK